eukprot:2133669-Pleurochrysis_carterae.AAC.2
MNAVTTDLDNTPTSASDDWQVGLFGVIPPPASAHDAWTDDCDDIDMCIDPTMRSAISSPSLGIIIMQGMRAIITATRSAFFLILLLLLQAASLMPVIP